MPNNKLALFCRSWIYPCSGVFSHDFLFIYQVAWINPCATKRKRINTFGQNLCVEALAKAIKLLLPVTALMALQGCLTTAQPVYPGDLQMIIAQSNGGSHSPQKEQVKAVSVDQLLASVRTSQNGNTDDQAVEENVSWIYKGDSVDDQPKTVIEPAIYPASNQRELQLNYHSSEMLPNAMQLMMAKRLAANQDMVLVGLSVGDCALKSPLVCANNAQQRAKRLLNELVGQRTVAQLTPPLIEYKPQLGQNVVIVIFARRES